jgi:hypothetical protein
MLGETTLPAAEVAVAPPSTTNRPATNVAFHQVAPEVFALGEVRFSKRNRTVSFPAQVNLHEGPIEYLVVSASGKTHESLLRTEAQPYHVHLAFLLLGAKGTTNALPAEAEKLLPGDAVEIEFSWTTNGSVRRARAEEFVHDHARKRTLPNGRWTFNGSRLREDGFAAQLDGSIVSLITDADALINNPRPGREDDDNWLVQTNGLPPLNSTVEVRIKLIR